MLVSLVAQAEGDGAKPPGMAPTAPRFLALGELPGGARASRALAVSADGARAVGASVVDDAGREAAFIWSEAIGLTPIGDLEGGARLSRATAVSSDGAYVVGTSHSSSGTEAFLWNAETGMLGLGDIPGGIFSSEGRGVSAGGLAVVGTTQAITGTKTATRGFRWTRETGMVELSAGPSDPRATAAFDVSADGRVIVGQIHTASGPEASLWIERGAGVSHFEIERPRGFAGRNTPRVATAISSDGRIVAGTAESSRGREAFRWIRGERPLALGTLPGGERDSSAEDLSGDGSRVVGSSSTAEGPQAFLWTKDVGMRSLSSILDAAGAPVPTGWRLEVAHGISGDGKIVVGTGRNPRDEPEGWMIVLPPDLR